MSTSPDNTSLMDAGLSSTGPKDKDLFDTPLFNRLLGLIEKQNATAEEQKKTLEEQKKTLDEHGRKFDVLIKDAFKDGLPYEEKPLTDEPTWSALYEIAVEKLREQAEEWKGLMDVSLVFIAIFLAVLTAFLVPTAQSLSPSSGEGDSASAPPPLPPRSAENVCALYYVSLITAMCNAVLCVLGRQWVGKLLTKPIGNSHLERTIRHEERTALAYVWIRPLVAILYWSLLLSIGIFITGLLYQLRNLATSFDQDAPILLAAWGLGIVLASGILASIAATTIHAVRFENSPFEGALSRAIMKVVGFVASRVSRSWEWRVGSSWSWDSQKQICTYFRLIAAASDPKLLDRVVPSFSYESWLLHGEESAHLLQGAYDRLVATDTSIRVRETIRAQFARFAAFCRGDNASPSRDGAGHGLIEFLIGQCSFPMDCPLGVLFTTLGEDNADLRAISQLPAEECMAKVLCTYDQTGNLGDRTEIYSQTLSYCHDLLHEGKEADLTRILSHVDPTSVLRSYIRSSIVYIPCLLTRFIARGRRPEILRELSPSLNDSANLENVGVMAQVLDDIVGGLPLGRRLPDDIDLSPLIESVYQSRDEVGSPLRGAKDAIMAYLDHCDISMLSKPRAIHKFLELCADSRRFADGEDEDGSDHRTRTRARAVLADYQSFFSRVFDDNRAELPNADLDSSPSGLPAEASVRIEMSEMST